MRNQRPVMVDIDDADPAAAINVFLHVLNKQRALGLMPRTAHLLAEHLLRGDAKVVFYSSAQGIVSLVESDDFLDDDDAYETVKFVMERRKKRILEKRAASAIEAAAADETGTGSAEGESAVPLAADAQPSEVS